MVEVLWASFPYSELATLLQPLQLSQSYPYSDRQKLISISDKRLHQTLM
ncbi:hypothetical protein [Sulfolobus spindle-shaped virus]|nr:hypothetical protein [Sulfolobus spindle-shaped virus]